MSHISLSRFLSFALSLALLQVGGLPEASATSARCAPVKECNKARGKAKAASGLTFDVGDGTTQENIDKYKNISSAGKAAACDAATSCEDQKKKCKPTPNGCSSEDCSSIQDAIETLNSACLSVGDTDTGADDYKAATAAEGSNEPTPVESSGGGGMGGALMPALLGAAAGGLLGYMLGKKKGEKDKDKDDDDYNGGALLPDGNLDCSKEDAYKYQGCNGVLENVCLKALEDPRCVAFAGRYCGPVAGSTTTTPVDPFAGVAPPVMNGPPTAIPGRPGEGVGSPFCKTSVASNFCKTPGRNQCPSCIQIQRSTAAECIADPSLCVAQNSPEQARQTCPTDPIFSDPTFVAGAGSGTGTAPGVVPMPSVQLPGDPTVGAPATTAAPTIPGAVAGTGAPNINPNLPGVIIQSVAGGDSGSAMREANGRAVGSSSSGGGTSTGYQAASAGGAGAQGHSRELASAGGMGQKALGPHGGPAVDVQGQYGPSLFAVGSQTIRNRCAAGKFNNCP